MPKCAVEEGQPLCERAPAGGVVISFDQTGPVSLRPTHGPGWAERARPERLRATFTAATAPAPGSAYDVHGDRLRLRLRHRRAALVHGHDPLLLYVVEIERAVELSVTQADQRRAP